MPRSSTFDDMKDANKARQRQETSKTNKTLVFDVENDFAMLLYSYTLIGKLLPSDTIDARFIFLIILDFIQLFIYGIIILISL